MARVTKLSIKGYRSIKDEIEIEFPQAMPLVLVGENNGGKSNIVRALNLMLGQFSPAYHEPEDHEFYGRDRSTAMAISVFFDEEEPPANKWTEMHWTYDESREKPPSLDGVWPGSFKTYIGAGDRESCVCMLIEAERNLVIEEPEAHLHPLAQKWLASRINNMCLEGLQVMLTTHNPAFINILNLEGLVPKGKRRAALEAYLRDVVRGSFPNLPYDEAAAEWHGGERARLESLGRSAPFVDGQIASIAHVHGLVLVTTNDRDFVRFKGLRVENWSKRHVRSKTERAEELSGHGGR